MISDVFLMIFDDFHHLSTARLRSRIGEGGQNKEIKIYCHERAHVNYFFFVENMFFHRGRIK